MKRTLHKALSMLLTAAMVLNMGLTTVFAESANPPGTSGVCTHHTEHTGCGYKAGMPCDHEHTEKCYTKELTCSLAEVEAPKIATDSDATLDSDDAPVDEAHSHGEDKAAFEATEQYTKLMAVMTANYAKAIGYKLPSVHNEIVFTDSTSIDTWAKSAVKEMQMAGILMGKDGGKFDPTGTATRAEVSAMLRRFVELVANS